jgi:hypothetical protein
MPRFLICKIEDGQPVAFLAGCAFREIQTVTSRLGARQFSDIELAESYARFWESAEPWALLQIVEATEAHNPEQL